MNGHVWKWNGNMERNIRKVNEKDLDRTLLFVQKVFTDSEGEDSGNLVRSLVSEIRSKKYYEPELDLVMVNEDVYGRLTVDDVQGVLDKYKDR